MAAETEKPVRVKFTQTIAETTGLPDPPVYKAGEVYDFKQSTADYWVARGVAQYAPDGGKPEPKPRTLAEMTEPELRKYASNHGVDVSKAKGRKEVLGVIEAIAASRAPLGGGGKAGE